MVRNPAITKTACRLNADRQNPVANNDRFTVALADAIMITPTVINAAHTAMIAVLVAWARG